MKAPDISIVMTFHRVGRLADPSIKAALAAIDYAKQRNVSVELMFVLDRPDQETEQVCTEYVTDDIGMFVVDFGSVALARNFGLDNAKGAFLAHFDSDDLFSENWLHDAFVQAKKTSTPSVFHPEIIVHFEGSQLLAKAIESDDLDYLKERMWEGTLWNAHAFANREIYKKHRFPQLEVESGFGYEDWHWTCETLTDGIKHVLVPDTMLCYRVKAWKSSLLMDLTKNNAVLGRTSLYNLAFQVAK